MSRISQDLKGKKIKLDLKDKKILMHLAIDARIPVSELAKKVGLKKDTISYRIKRMQKMGLIQKFYPDIDFIKFNYRRYHVFILLSDADQDRYMDLIERLKSHPNTMSVIEYSDRWDLEWVLMSNRIKKFDETLSDFIADFTDIILERSNLIVVNNFHSTILPVYLDDNMEKTKNPVPESSYVPDLKDFYILRELSRNCRQSTYDISKNVALSPDAIGIRIKKLVNSGIIKRFTVLLNLSLLGYSWYTFVIQTKYFDKQHESKFRYLVENHKSIIRAVKSIGYWDILIYIIAKDQRAFHKTVKNLRKEFAGLIGNHSTFVAYKEHVFNSFPDIILNDMIGM